MPVISKKATRFGRISAVAILGILFAAAAQAQIPTSGNVFFGYSYLHASDLSSNSANFNGWEGSFEGKVFPFVGIVADFSGEYGSQDVSVATATCAIGATCPTGKLNINVHNYLFGPRVSVSVRKFRPFAEALFGGAHLSEAGFGSDTSFATAIGGGLDYKIIRPVAWRFQGDYVQTRFFGTTQNNVRISTGIVLRF